MTDLARSTPDGLRVYVDFKGSVPARDAGNILAAIDRAFFRFARDEVGISNARLRIVETGTGSWWVLLTAAKELYDLGTTYPDLIPLFVNNIDTTYRILIDQRPDETKKHFVDLLRDLAKSGKRIGAKAIDISSIVSTSIRSVHFDTLIDAQSTEGYRTPLLQHSTLRHSIPIYTDATVIEQAGALAQTGQLFGTIFKVDGSWYARPEGMSGVLLPLTFSTLAKLTVEDGVAYRIAGELLKSAEGYPIGIQVANLTHLGSRGREIT